MKWTKTYTVDSTWIVLSLVFGCVLSKLLELSIKCAIENVVSTCRERGLSFVSCHRAVINLSSFERLLLFPLESGPLILFNDSLALPLDIVDLCFDFKLV